jgi:hypothetical protein
MSFQSFITISKPRKQENGTYEGKVYTDKKKHVKLHINNALVIKVKSGNDNQNYMYLKERSIAKDLYDLNNQVVEQVKENCFSWFRIHLNEDLIEDYCSSCVMYDKKFGQVLKFKCLNDISNIPCETHVNVDITLVGIRFYKQKFVLEWNVEQVEQLCNMNISDLSDDDSIVDDEYEVPCPDQEELATLKASYFAEASRRCDNIMVSIDELQKKRDSINLLLEELQSLSDFTKISRVCDELDILLE